MKWEEIENVIKCSALVTNPRFALEEFLLLVQNNLTRAAIDAKVIARPVLGPFFLLWVEWSGGLRGYPIYVQAGREEVEPWSKDGDWWKAE
jgi:hypothetical protein